MSDLQAMVDGFVERYGVHVCEHGRVEVNRESCRTDLAALIRTAQAEALREAARDLVRYYGTEKNPSIMAWHADLVRRADEVPRG